MTSLLHALSRNASSAASASAPETAPALTQTNWTEECLNRLATAALWLQEYEEALQAGKLPAHTALSLSSNSLPAFSVELTTTQPLVGQQATAEPPPSIETEALQPFELKDVVQATLVQELGLELLSKTLLLERLTHQVLQRLSQKGIKTLEALAPA